MKISDIKIGERHRKDLGIVAGLADSIKTQGLLQPIGINEDNELVFGYRRLVACRDHLGWTDIDTRTVNVTSIVAGEYAENEMRKDFTVSERVAILKTIETMPHGGDRKSNDRNQAKPISLDNKMTRAEAAVLAGLGNHTSAREACILVDQGAPELIAAVDRGEIGIYPGFVISGQPPERQAEIVKLPVTERREALRDLPRSGTGKKKKIVGPKEAPRERQPSAAALLREQMFLNRPKLKAKQTARPTGAEALEQAPGWPAGTNKAMAYTEEHGRVEPFSHEEVVRQKLYARFIEFNAMIRKLVKEDWPTYADLATLDDRRRVNVLAFWRRHRIAPQTIRKILDATLGDPLVVETNHGKAIGDGK